VAAPPGQATRAPAAIRIAGMWPGGTCRHPHWRHALVLQHAATPIGGRALLLQHAATPIGGRAHPAGRLRTETDMPTTAAGACRHWPRRHVPRVTWPGVPPLVGGLFDKIFRRWSFLAFQSRRWSYVSKIPPARPPVAFFFIRIVKNGLVVSRFLVFI
jgi:hypothetical protein